MTFAPFTIHCPTCGAHLRVTNPALAGTIANCPKCQSFVEIADPNAAPESAGTSDDDSGPPSIPGAPVSGVANDSERMAIGTDPVDSEAITQDGVEPPGSIDPDVSPRGFSSNPGDPSAIHADGPFPPPVSGVPGDVVAPPAWQSERTRRTRHVALVIAISIAGLIVTAALFAWFVHTWTGTNRDIAASETAATENTHASDREDASDGEPDDDTQPDSGQDPANESDRPDNSSTSQDPGARDPDTPSDPETANASERPANPDSAIPSDLLTESPLAGIEVPSGTVPPAGTVPPGGPVTPTGPVAPNGRRPGAAPDETGGMTELPSSLSQYTPFLGMGQEEGDTTAKIAPPTSIDQLELDTPAEEVIDPMMEANPLPKIDLRRVLDTEMAFASDGYPLSDFALVIGQLTGAPVEIDWVSFDLVGVDIRTPVPTAQEMIAAAQHLDRAAAAVGAEVVWHDRMVRVTPTDQTFRGAVGPRMTLEDFGDGRDTASAVLAEFLGEPDEDSNDDPVRWGEDRTDWQLAALAVETLRRTRGLPATMPDERYFRWAGPAGELASWRPLTGGDPGDPLETSVTMSQLLRQTARRNGATCVINWNDALRRRMAANRNVMPHPDSDAADLIAETLDPLGLQVRKVSEDAWWLGTEATYDRLPVVVWTEPLGDRREPVEQRLVTLMGAPGSDTYRYAHDPATDRAIMLLPRFIVRQFPTILADKAASPTP